MKRVVILQPSYLPWLGYFDQINKADIFVFLDDVQYSKGDWRNRNKIKVVNDEWVYLTAPILTTGFFLSRINQVKIDYKSNWTRKHLSTFSWNYRKAYFFPEVFTILQEILLKKIEFLSDLNIELILKFSEYLSIKNCKFLKSSQLNIGSYKNSTERLIKICKLLEATHYLSGGAAKEYLNENLFIENNIVLEYQNYEHPIYKQLGDNFIPYLSVVDLLFNEGKKSLEILTNK